MIELLPCPNKDCKSENIGLNDGVVTCYSCGMEGPRKDSFGDKWNGLMRDDYKTGLVPGTECAKALGYSYPYFRDLISKQEGFPTKVGNAYNFREIEEFFKKQHAKAD